MNRLHLEPAIALLILVGSLGSVTAMAGNLGFLKDSPVSYFSEEDTAQMMNAATDALNDSAPRPKREWKNPTTGNSGQLEVLRSFKLADGTACRTLQVSNQAKGIESRATYPLCKAADGTWIIRAGAKPGQ